MRTFLVYVTFNKVTDGQIHVKRESKKVKHYLNVTVEDRS